MKRQPTVTGRDPAGVRSHPNLEAEAGNPFPDLSPEAADRVTNAARAIARVWLRQPRRRRRQVRRRGRRRQRQASSRGA